jgi:hypothetical protein
MVDGSAWLMVSRGMQRGCPLRAPRVRRVVHVMLLLYVKEVGISLDEAIGVKQAAVRTLATGTSASVASSQGHSAYELLQVRRAPASPLLLPSPGAFPPWVPMLEAPAVPEAGGSSVPLFPLPPPTLRGRLQSKKEKGLSYIVTFVMEVDTLLGGGVQLGEVTEICELSAGTCRVLSPLLPPQVSHRHAPPSLACNAPPTHAHQARACRPLFPIPAPYVRPHSFRLVPPPHVANQLLWLMWHRSLKVGGGEGS